MITNEKSLKKDGKNFPRVIRAESFFKDFSFINHLFEVFNPPLGDFSPLWFA